MGDGERDRRQDLEAIERLHRRDMAAARSGDFEALRSVVTDEAVILPPGGRPVRGRAELDAGFERMRETMQDIEVLDYVLDFEEVEVVDDTAYEWGWIRGSMRPKGGGPVQRSAYKVLRILRREADGEWRVHRSMWNAAPQDAQAGGG